ncbi:MAG TPA: NAD(P)/FAD-dependent oxidoreductase [Chthoniobacterales bacterium]|jgi:menaquinone-9 beta-reductase|nr:NAD(P)/FAD-dependent oxidoreductase [Chthoniobacterales bacterium]
MELVDVAIAGGGPAGSTCAAFCAAAGLRTLVIEREKFPREKVCGDCINPGCWPVLERLEVAQQIRSSPHGALEAVEFIAINGKRIHIDLPLGDRSEIAIKRSLFDQLLLNRARVLGADIREEATLIALEKTTEHNWKIDIVREIFIARVVVGADGRNSTVARLRNLLPRPERERVSLQAHIPLPRDFGNRVVLQFLPEGYSGQAPVNGRELNLCLVGTPPTISSLRNWAERHFSLPADQPWRTITPLTRDPVPVAHENLFFIGDAARVVEPFTGEGIYYALRSGELAAEAIVKIIRGEDRESAVRDFASAHRAMYRGRLWVNQLARAAVLSPKVASALLPLARLSPVVLRGLTGKIVRPR